MGGRPAVARDLERTQAAFHGAERAPTRHEDQHGLRDVDHVLRSHRARRGWARGARTRRSRARPAPRRRAGRCCRPTDRRPRRPSATRGMPLLPYPTGTSKPASSQPFREPTRPEHVPDSLRGSRTSPNDSARAGFGFTPDPDAGKALRPGRFPARPWLEGRSGARSREGVRWRHRRSACSCPR